MFPCWWPCSVLRIKLKTKLNQSDADLRFSYEQASTNIQKDTLNPPTEKSDQI